jgi:SAM-dependent methyltransferase
VSDLVADSAALPRASANMDHACQVCGGSIERIDAYARLPRVTSDCKPWPAGGTMALCRDCGAIQKVADAAWLAEIARIYRAYQIYHLSDGAEQVIFAGANAFRPRSSTLVSFVLRAIDPPIDGRLLDIGCGNGAALANFSTALPGWSLFGSELSEAVRPSLERIANFVELYTVPPNRIPGQFDIVSMIHALEHMPAPLDTLRGGLARLADGATMFVEVPDVESSPFDLLVADHLMHFSRATLGYLAARAGLSVDVLRNDVLPKEITLLAKKGQPSAKQPDPAAGVRILNDNLVWLERVLASATAAAGEAASFGIFGTSISGMWLYGALADRVGFFLDEDQSRIGRSYQGRPILAPADRPAGATVYVPLAPAIAGQVVERHRDNGRGGCFIGPPPLAEPSNDLGSSG